MGTHSFQKRRLEVALCPTARRTVRAIGERMVLSFGESDLSQPLALARSFGSGTI